MNSSSTKRVLVLAGGASFGAFQAGVVRELAESGIEWDVIYGTSVGAINGAYLASGYKSEIKTRSTELCDFWCSLKTSDIYKLTWKSFFESMMFWKMLSHSPGFFDTTPLRNLIHERMGPKPKMPLRIFATPVLGGQIVMINENVDDIRPWVLASSAVPVLFPPVSIDGVIYMDGGVRQNNPTAQSMRSEIVNMDIILCFPDTGSIKKSDKVSLLTVAYKTLRASTDQFLEAEALLLKLAHPENVRIIRPDIQLPYNPLEFKNSQEMINIGREIASRSF